jgi:hypothetical protein
VRRRPAMARRRAAGGARPARPAAGEADSAAHVASRTVAQNVRRFVVADASQYRGRSCCFPRASALSSTHRASASSASRFAVVIGLFGDVQRFCRRSVVVSGMPRLRACLVRRWGLCARRRRGAASRPPRPPTAALLVRPRGATAGRWRDGCWGITRGRRVRWFGAGGRGRAGRWR